MFRTRLLYKYFLSIHNVYALCRLFHLSALQIIDTFPLSAFTFHLGNAGFNFYI